MKRYRPIAGLAALALGLALAAAPAFGQAACGERDAITSALLANHGEVLVARGLATDGVMIEVLAAESGTFTVLLTRPTGVSCLITAGDYWETLPLEAPAAWQGEGL